MTIIVELSEDLADVCTFDEVDGIPIASPCRRLASKVVWRALVDVLGSDNFLRNQAYRWLSDPGTHDQSCLWWLGLTREDPKRTQDAILRFLPMASNRPNSRRGLKDLAVVLKILEK